MAKLYFYYSAMNAGKSTTLLQSANNYQERGMDTLLFTPAIDDRHAKNKIHSRIGLEADAISFDSDFDFFVFTQKKKLENPILKCVFIDEAQFLNREQVYQLSEIVDKLSLPVLAYGLRTDFQGQPFPGSIQLLLWADIIAELKTICYCGSKAIMNARFDANGKIVTRGAQIQIGGNEQYIAMCRKHFKEAHEKSVLSLV